MSMKASLNVLSEADGRKVAILGNMYELGDNEAELHRQVGEEAARLKIDEVICIGDLAQNIADATKSGCNMVYHFNNKQDFESDISEYIKPGDTVLIKASNGMKFTTIVNLIKETFKLLYFEKNVRLTTTYQFINLFSSHNTSVTKIQLKVGYNF